MGENLSGGNVAIALLTNAIALQNFRRVRDEIYNYLKNDFVKNIN